MKKALYGDEHDHPDLARTVHEQGKIAKDKCEYSKAEKLFKESLAMQRRLYGHRTDHLSISNVLYDLGKNIGRSDSIKAVEYFTEYLAMRQRLFKNSPNCIEILERLDELIGLMSNADEYIATASRMTTVLSREQDFRTSKFEDAKPHFNKCRRIIRRFHRYDVASEYSTC